MTNDRNDILAVIPTYNNEKTVARVIADVRRYCAHVLVVNDGSTDRTGEICRAHGFRMLDLSINVGLSYAVKAGMRYAFERDYAFAVQFDGDGQHDIRYIDLLLKPVREDLCDIAIGSRFLAKRAGFSLRTLGGRIISFTVFLSSG